MSYRPGEPLSPKILEAFRSKWGKVVEPYLTVWEKIERVEAEFYEDKKSMRQQLTIPWSRLLMPRT